MKVAFIHGRPAPHPSHSAMAQSLNADLHVVDPYLRWNGISVWRVKRYLSWFICAIFFPNRSSYDLFLTEGCHFTPIVMKKLGLLRRNQKIAALMGDNTLYFLKEKRYSKYTQYFLLYALRQFDGIICIGEMQTLIAHELFKDLPIKPPIYTVPNEIFLDRGLHLDEIKPGLQSDQILVIANGPDGFRSWYKGMDLVFQAFEFVLKARPQTTLSIAGEWSDNFIEETKKIYPSAFARTEFKGSIHDLRPLFESSALLVLLGRGDAFPLAIMESLHAGLPALVSQWTGTSVVVNDADPRLVVKLDAAETAERILWYFALKSDEKSLISKACRNAVALYTPERAYKALQESVESIIERNHNKPEKVAFIHGRPAPHPFHATLARSVGAELMVVDPILRWNGLDVTAFRRYTSWLLCGLFFPERNRFDLFMTEGGHATPVVMRVLGLLNQRQRTVALMDNETFYFMKSGRYPKQSINKLKWMFKRFDALICVNDMQARLAKELISPEFTGVQILTIHSCVQKERAEAFSRVNPILNGKNVLCIANGPGGFRSWYKGIDLVFGTMEAALEMIPDLTLMIAGEWNDAEMNSLAGRFPKSFSRCTWAGQMMDVSPVLEQASLCIQMGRGDAGPISILESMLAGVPILASEWTGLSEAVAQVDKNMVVPLDATAASRQVVRYFQLSVEERTTISRKGREVASTYTEERAMREFREAVDTVMRTPRKGIAG